MYPLKRRRYTAYRGGGPFTRNKRTMHIVGNRSEEVAKTRVNVGASGMRFVEAVMNPFGSGTVGPKSVRATIPDGTAHYSSSFVLTQSCNYEVGVAGRPTSGVVTIVPPLVGGGAAAILVFGGNDVTNPANSPNATWSSATWSENAIFVASTATLARIRIVSAGLRLYAISSTDNTSGIVDAALSDRNLLETAAPTYNTYANYINYMVEESHPLLGKASGITVRRPCQTVDQDFADIPAAAGVGISSYAALGKRPMIRFQGLGANTVLRIDAVWHIEALVSPVLFPGHITLQQAEVALASLISFCNAHEVVVSGNSFKSFLKKAASTVGSVGRYVAANKSWIVPLAGMAARAMM